MATISNFGLISFLMFECNCVSADFRSILTAPPHYLLSGFFDNLSRYLAAISKTCIQSSGCMSTVWVVPSGASPRQLNSLAWKLWANEECITYMRLARLSTSAFGMPPWLKVCAGCRVDYTLVFNNGGVEEEAALVIRTCINLIRLYAIASFPLIPFTSQKLFDALHLKEADRMSKLSNALKLDA